MNFVGKKSNLKMTALFRTEQIRRLESLTYSKKIDTEIGLMRRAGEAAFDVLQSKWPLAKSILVVAGKGNNAGDGFVVARLAKKSGFVVHLVTLAIHSEYKDPAKTALDEAIAQGVKLQRYQGQLNVSVDVVVDALIGIGIRGEVKDHYKTVIEQINTMGQPVLALDVPSGLDADTGSVRGVAIKADLTVTFIAAKQGLLTHNASAHCGTLVTTNLQLPTSLFQKVTPSAELMDWHTLCSHLPKRRRDAHKGRYGHLLIVGGDYGMGGAVRMAAEAALRVGSGLVTVATRPEHVPVVSTNRPEIMCYQVASANDLEPLLKRATVVVLGPGLGKTEWSKDLLSVILAHEHPKLLDADALNLLSENPQRNNHWVLTPHPGEAGRLLNCSTQAVQDDRFASVRSVQEKYGGVIVLKGAGSLVQMADTLPQICPAGNPGMASAGMGDVLSGVIGGLMAQKLPIPLAAQIGVMVHALAADRAAEEGGERGLLATDLMNYLRQLVNPNE